jgi:hypothetical protein
MFHHQGSKTATPVNQLTNRQPISKDTGKTKQPPKERNAPSPGHQETPINQLTNQ